MASEEVSGLMRLGDDDVKVRVSDGYLTRVLRRVRLSFGPQLYCARQNPMDEDQIMPYQPGYMALVKAMGGYLRVPRVMADPLTGEPVLNPRVELGSTGQPSKVTATAVCVVPHPVTGELHASVQTLTVDAMHVLRQSLMKIDREDAVRLLASDDVERAREAGEIRGWVVFPYAPMVSIAANLDNARVRDALATYSNQAESLVQRACSKAERLACDHNPITRRTWTYGELRYPRDPEGNVTGPGFIEVPVVAWVRHREQEQIDVQVRTLATSGEADDVASVMIEASVDDASPAPEDEVSDRERLEAIASEARERAPAPEPTPAPAPEPAPEPEPAPAPAGDPMLVDQVRRLARALAPNVWMQCWERAGLMSKRGEGMESLTNDELRKLRDASMDAI